MITWPFTHYDLCQDSTTDRVDIFNAKWKKKNTHSVTDLIHEKKKLPFLNVYTPQLLDSSTHFFFLSGEVHAFRYYDPFGTRILVLFYFSFRNSTQKKTKPNTHLFAQYQISRFLVDLFLMLSLYIFLFTRVSKKFCYILIAWGTIQQLQMLLPRLWRWLNHTVFVFWLTNQRSMAQGLFKMGPSAGQSPHMPGIF